MEGQIYAPFTSEQVKGLNEYQVSGAFHEFTCGNPKHPKHGRKTKLKILVAHETGWICPGCGYRQYSAWEDQANGKMVNAMNSYREKLVDRIGRAKAYSKNIKAPHTVCGSCEMPDCICNEDIKTGEI